MTTLTRLAGMADVPNPHDPDPEAQPPHLTPQPSRSSLPPSRRPSSHRSLRSRPSSTTTIPPVPPLPTAADDDDIPWGPRHPCFPHPNPHAPRGSTLAASTRIVRIPRDWLVAGDAYPALANVYPEILDGWVSETQFRDLVSGLNERLRKAFDASGARAAVDAVLGPLTGWLWEDIGATGAKAGVRELERFVDAWNAEREQEGSPARAVQLRRTGYMNLDIQIPDPQIDGTAV